LEAHFQPASFSVGAGPRVTVSRLIFDALRSNPEGGGHASIGAFIIKEEGFDPDMAATIRQRCMMAMYRFIDRGQIVKEMRGPVSVWRLA
jgi:hypothetical protein